MFRQVSRTAFQNVVFSILIPYKNHIPPQCNRLIEYREGKLIYELSSLLDPAELQFPCCVYIVLSLVGYTSVSIFVSDKLHSKVITFS